MKIITHMLEDKVYESSNEDGNKLVIDMRARELKQQQSPVEVLLSSVAACAAVDIVLMLKKRKKTIQHFTIETEGTRRTETPRSFTSIHCKYSITSADVTEEELTKTARLALEKYCSVADSLKCKVDFSVEVIRP
ncbi:MAG: OsmC family protein [Cyclobacteriaceae bacterium]|nr:OsmC family protein [Cyclobacteriaceae bacterium]